MLGAIIGDIVGSRFEFDRGNKSSEFELFTPACKFTDDSVMTVAVAEALMDVGKDADEKTTKANLIKSMKKWGQKYPDSGYGARFIDWVLTDDPQPYGSYGNGSGMRVSAVGWFYDTIERTREVARWTAEITHNHPEGIKGAESTAAMIFMARKGASKEEIKRYVEDEFGYDLSRTLDEIRPTYQHVEDCMHTMPEAFTCFLEADSYEATLRNVMYIGGDTDTLCAIAGSIAEAFWKIQPRIATKAKAYLPDDILSIIHRVYKFTDGACPNVKRRSGFDCPVRAVPVDIRKIEFTNIPTGLMPGASDSEKASCKGIIQEDEEFIELPNGNFKLVKKYENEKNYNKMSSKYEERPAQIPLRKNRLDYLLSEYSPKETDRWILFIHPNHFVIYDRETKHCIYDIEYVVFEKPYDEDNPIVAVIPKIKVNQDHEQHPIDIDDDFNKAFELIINEL